PPSFFRTTSRSRSAQTLVPLSLSLSLSPHRRGSPSPSAVDVASFRCSRAQESLRVPDLCCLLLQAPVRESGRTARLGRRVRFGRSLSECSVSPISRNTVRIRSDSLTTAGEQAEDTIEICISIKILRQAFAAVGSYVKGCDLPPPGQIWGFASTDHLVFLVPADPDLKVTYAPVSCL
ncbi:eukaryotic initiation factor, partial [Musa troglodytarum]